MEDIREFERETQILLQKKYGGGEDDDDGNGNIYFFVRLSHCPGS